MTTDYIDAMTQFEIPSNPFPGLRPFEFSESLLYFGRDGQSEQLLRRLAAARFMAVVGTSGSGKSSLVRAGLLPALFGGFMTSAGSEWRIALLRPGNDPIGNLAHALNTSSMRDGTSEQEAKLQATMTEATLRRSSLGLVEAVRQARLGPQENVLVVADQFEELFRFAAVTKSERYQNEAAAFVKLLLEAGRQKEVPIYVVLTMRSDFLGDCSLFWDLPEAINEGQYLIPRLTREQRREAIAGPVAVCGASMTPRLINRLLNDVGDNQDQLPILQHALMRTWNNWKAENRESDPVDLRHYEAIGGMSAALSLHAEEAFNELAGERSRKIAEKIFKGLTEKGADNREIRRPVVLRELCAIAEATEAEVIAVIEVFRREGRSFLMPPAGTRLDSDSLVDISHESLIRNWERLKTWVEEEARSARIYRRLAETAALREKGEAGLYRDPDLQLALDWREQSKPNQTWARRYHTEFETAMNFLDLSREARDHEARQREARRKRELRRIRLFLAIISIAFLLSSGMAVFAWQQRTEAIKLKASAVEEKTRAEEEEARAEAASLIALEAKKKAEEEEARAEAASLRALDEKKRAEEEEARAEAASLRALEEKNKAQQEVERSRRLLYAANINLAQDAYYEANIQLAQELLKDPSTNYEDLRGFEWGYLDWLYHREAGTLDGGDGNVRDITFSSDKKYMATAGDTAVKIWDASTRREILSIPTGKAPVNALAFSPDDKLLAYGGENKLVRLQKIGSAEEPDLLGGSEYPITSLLFSRDGKTLYAGSKGELGSGTNKVWTGEVMIWDVASRKERTKISSITGGVISLALSPDQNTLALAGYAEGMLFLDLRANPLQTEFAFTTTPSTTSPYSSVAFSPDGKTIIAGTRHGFTFEVYDVKEKKNLATLGGFFRGSESPAFSHRGAVVFSPDGKTFAVGGYNTVRMYETAKLGEPVPPVLITPLLGQQGFISSLVFSADGKTLAANDSGQVRFWDATAPRDSLSVAREQFLVGDIFFSPDSKIVSMLNSGGRINAWDTAALLRAQVAASQQKSQPELSIPAKLEGELKGMAYSAGGRFIATINGERADTINLWDTASRKMIATLSEDLPRSKTANEIIRKVAASPDGKTLAAINLLTKKTSDFKETHECILKLWNTNSPRKPVILDPIILKSDTDCVDPSLVFSPDGRTLARFGQVDKVENLQLWDVASRKVVSLRSKDIRSIERVVFSPDGSKIVVIGYNESALRFAELWDARSPKLIKALAKGRDLLCVFSPDGKVFALSSMSEKGPEVRLWDTRLGEPVTAFEGYTRGILCMTFSPDGKIFATGSKDGYVKLWSTSSYRLLITLYDENEEAFNSMAFSPDNKMLITGGEAGNVRLWPTASAYRQQYRER